MTRIEPRTLKGFRDLLPAQALWRARKVRVLEDVFLAHGYGPIETPALEYAEILKGKSGEESDKELFEFLDKGGRPVALRMDLTVPLARYVAEHQNVLAFPFRRYHVGSVWRGERPQKGRFREFLQCDADLVGAVGVAADAESVVTFLSAYEALDVGRVTIRLNDRRILTGLLERYGGSDATSRTVPVLRALDKREKLGEEAVRREMETAGLSASAVTELLRATTAKGDDEATLASLEADVGASEAGTAGIAGLRGVYDLVRAAGKDVARLRVDPTIARGLDYYTGIVFEASLEGAAGFGSVGSGGRYDDLAALYTTTRLPGVGCSVGLDRLLAAVEETGALPKDQAPSAVLVTHPEEPSRLAQVFALATALRSAAIATETYPEPRKHAAQMKYADRRAIPFALTVDADGSIHGKVLRDGTTFTAATARDAVEEIRRRLL